MSVGASFSDGATAVRAFTNLTPATVISGAGSLARLPEAVERVGAGRYLIVTGKSLAATSLPGRVEALLGGKSVGTFAEVEQHVPSRSVLAAAHVARQRGVDAVVALGGGSSIDTARAAAALSVADRDLQELEYLGLDDLRAISAGVAPANMPCVVTISTTLSGAEWTPYAGVTDERTKIKSIMRHRAFIPALSVLDPELTTFTPMTLWLSTGMRAVDHCVESLYATTNHPLIEVLAARALGILRLGLRATRRDPNDIAARAACQFASWFSFFSIDTVMIGPSHGLGHQVGSMCDVPHGFTSCILLPAVMRYLRPKNARRQRVIAEALGIPTERMSDDAAAAAAEDAIRGLVADLGMPARLRDVGVPREALPAIAANALREQIGMMRSTGVVLDRQEQLVQILESAY